MASQTVIDMVRPHIGLIKAARLAARELGNHYGAFLVGAAGLFEMPDGSTKVFTGGNYKPTKATEKKCAEHFMFKAAEAAGAIRCIVFAVAGPQKGDDESGMEGITLHPCGVCRTNMMACRLIDDNTVIITIQFDNGDDIEVELLKAVIEVHTLRALLHFHNHPPA